MTSRTAVKTLLAFVIGLPIVMAVLGWVVGLLGTMDDEGAAVVLRHVTTGFSILWLVTVVGLVVALAFESLDDESLDGPHEQ